MAGWDLKSDNFSLEDVNFLGFFLIHKQNLQLESL